MPEIFQIEKGNRITREIIKVVGVGGGGNNALNHIIRGGVEKVDFIAANTDHAHLNLSEAQNKIILGRELTRGLGAGANPDVGQKSAQESRDEIRAMLDGADMVFLAAGMGGGTGTGATPVIANIARETGALVVAVVTRPFKFEGQRRAKLAAEGIDRLREEVDALVVIPTERLLAIADRKTSLNDAFKLADNVLHQAVQGVTDLILRPGLVNVDFADVRTVMSNAGPAIMGIGEGYGENRVVTAAHNAINSPLMETPMIGAKGVLFNVTGGANVSLHEITDAAELIRNASDEDASVIWGHVFDPSMEDAVQITVIATGFADAAAYTPVGGILRPATVAQSNVKNQTPIVVNTREKPSQPTGKVKLELEESETRIANNEEDLFRSSGVNNDQLDIPAYTRRRRTP